VRQRREETIRVEELLKPEFSVRPVQRCYKQDKSGIQLVVRQSPASKDVNTDAEEAMAMKAVTRRQPVETQQIERTVCSVVNCRMCELAIAL
jgi:hypothetical protein